MAVRGRTWGQSQRLAGAQPAEHPQRTNPEVMDALLEEACEWTPSGSILGVHAGPERTQGPWWLEEVRNKGGPDGFPSDVEPPPQSSADVERSKFTAAWHEATKIELDEHKTTGAYTAATPPQGRSM